MGMIKQYMYVPETVGFGGVVVFYVNAKILNKNNLQAYCYEILYEKKIHLILFF